MDAEVSARIADVRALGEWVPNPGVPPVHRLAVPA
jgi:hypothetical protein